MFKDPTHFKVAIAVAICIVLLQCGIGICVYYAMPDWSTRGQFGDMFGAANATFSGLAFAGLIYAILLQREDLALQRAELELTRQELKRSATAQELSEVALRTQAESAAMSARLSAISFLLEQYKKEFERFDVPTVRANDSRLARANDLSLRIGVLSGILETVYQDLSGKGEADG
jgi:hypothetical protein